jgi:hypothetical protein
VFTNGQRDARWVHTPCEVSAIIEAHHSVPLSSAQLFAWTEASSLTPRPAAPDVGRPVRSGDGVVVVVPSAAIATPPGDGGELATDCGGEW